MRSSNVRGVRRCADGIQQAENIAGGGVNGRRRECCGASYRGPDGGALGLELAAGNRRPSRNNTKRREHLSEQARGHLPAALSAQRHHVRIFVSHRARSPNGLTRQPVACGIKAPHPPYMCMCRLSWPIKACPSQAHRIGNAAPLAAHQRAHARFLHNAIRIGCR